MTAQAPLSLGLRPHVLQGLLILLATYWIYAPAFHGDWLWDDNVLITENPLMKDPAGWWKMWLQPWSAPDYYPLTTTVERVEWTLWGMEPLGYHLVNVALHITSALLVWRLLARLGLRFAWLGGLLFAIHPVQVESVAWAAELKNALSLPPFLLAMIAWVDYDRSARGRDYFLALGLFLVALLCKLTVVMFPVVILLYAWWRRGRIGVADVKASVPFFALSLVLGLVPVLTGAWARHFTHLDPIFVPEGGAVGRILLAGQEFAFYFLNCIWPVGLLPVYPKWVVNPASPLQYVPWLALAALLVWFWTRRASWGKHALLGVGFFLVNLLPCPGFIPASNMGYSWVMDHFLYLPLIGLIGLAVAALETPFKSARIPTTGVIVVLAVVLICGSHAYAKLYRGPMALWTYALRHNPGSWMVHVNLGDAYLRAGASAEAIDQFETAQKLNPAYLAIRYNLANALSQAGRLSDAITQYQIVANAGPDYHDVSYYLGTALAAAGRNAEAKTVFEQLLMRNPQHTGAHLALGNILQAEGDTAGATEQFAQASGTDPNSDQLHYLLGNALMKANRLPEALKEYQQAAEINPSQIDIRGNLGVVLARLGRLPEAAEQFQIMLQIDPNSAAAHTNIGSLFLVARKYPEAIAQYQEALRLKPDFAEAQQDLARAQAMEKAAQAEPGAH